MYDCSQNPIAPYSYTKGLKDGTLSVLGVQFEHVEISPAARR